MVRRTALFTVFAFACVTLAVDDPDPVRDRLVAAKTAYDAEIVMYKKQVVEWLNRREDGARKAGDKKLLDQIRDDRKVYEEDGIPPKTLPAGIKQKPALARKVMDAAYASAVKEYTKAKRDAEAAAVEAAWKAFTGENVVDLLALIDPKAHTVAGEWKREGKTLVGTKSGRLLLPYEPGEEYDVEATVRRVAGADGFCIGVVAGGRQCIGVVDAWPMRGYVSGIELIDEKDASDNASTVKGQLLRGDKYHTVTCSVRAGKVAVLVDGKGACEFKGEFSRLSIFDALAVPNKKALFLHIGPDTTFQVNSLVVTPVRGKGTVVK